MSLSDQLEVLDAIVRLGSFNAAAKSLHRVQSAISYSIKTLESDLGVALFSREGYRPQLTQAGQAIYRKSQTVLSALEELRLLAERMRQGQEPMVRLDLSPICPTGLITPILKHIANEYPQTQLKISMEIFGGEALVLNDEADMTLTDQMQPHPSLEWHHTLSIPMVAVISSKHPLARGNRSPDELEMSKHFQIVVRSQSQYTEARSFGVMQGNMTWRVNDFPTKRQLLLDGLGWGHMPQLMISQDLASGDLIELDLDFLPKNTARLRLVRKRHKPHGPVATRLWDLLLERLSKHRSPG